MKRHPIKGLPDGNEDGDAVNVSQLNEAETNLTNYVDREITKLNSKIVKVYPTLKQ